jgi:hypothetical protein
VELDDRTVDELLAVVGAERDSHPPDEVAAAEERLRSWASVWPELSLRHLRWAGVMAAALGLAALLAVAVWVLPFVGTPSFLALYLREPGIFGWVWFRLAVCVLPALALVVGGIAVCWRRGWARLLIVVSAWVLLALCVLAAAGRLLPTAVFTPLMLPVDPMVPLVAGAIAGAPLLMALFLFLMARYFSSDEAKALCRPRGASEAECKLRAIGGLSAAGGILICGWWVYSQVSAFAAVWDLPEIGWSWLAGIGGVVLVVGGLGIRRQREWARRTLLAAAWGLLTLGGLLAVTLVARAVGSDDLGATAILLAFLLPALVIDIAALVVLVLLSRYLASSGVKAICSD